MSDKILLIQLPVPQLVPQELTGNTPLATATLLLYCKRTGVTAEVMLMDTLLQDRLGDAALVQAITTLRPDVAGFTCTVWNVERVLHIARLLKTRLDGIRIWMGGPEVAGDGFLLNQPDPPFDLAIEGEGELPFAALAAGVEPHLIPRVHIPGKEAMAAGRTSFLDTLDPVSDPFVDGLVRMQADKVMLAEFIRGCRYRCMFCQYHHGRSAVPSAMRSTVEINRTFAWAREQGVAEIFLLDPSLEQRGDYAGFLAHLATINHDPAIPLFAELRAEYVDEPAARALYDAGVRSVETGLQTVNEQALRRAGRTFTREKFTRGIRAMHDAGISVKADIMAGLPDDTPQGMNDTIDYVTDLGLAEHVQFFRTQVLPGTVLRRDATILGIEYEPRPPYFVLATPLWPRRELEESIHVAEKRLGVSFSAEDRPVLVTPQWNDSGIDKRAFPGTTALFFAGWNLENTSAVPDLAGETFAGMSNAASLLFQTPGIMRHLKLITDAVRRCIGQNPYCSLCTAIDLQPGSPLDLFDEIDAVFDDNTVSHYCDRMFQTATTSRPQRRQLALLDLNLRHKIDREWAHDLRDLCQIVWRTGPVSTAEALQRAAEFETGEDDDYLFIDLEEGSGATGIHSFCKDLAKKAALPGQILLPGLDIHWRYVGVLEGENGEKDEPCRLNSDHAIVGFRLRQ